MYKLQKVSCYITSNCIRIDSHYSPLPVPISLWLLQAPNYHPSTLDTLCTMLIGHITLHSFPHPTFWQWYWSPHKVDINNSLIHGSWFRKEVISYQFIVSKSLIIMPDFSIYLYQCILFYYILLILARFPNSAMFLFLYDCVLWSLVVTVETVIDMMIDGPVKTMNYNICKSYTSIPTWLHYFCFV